MKADYPPKPIKLNGHLVDLVPMSLEHLDGLIEAVKDGSLWKLWYTLIPEPAKMNDWIVQAMDDQNNLKSLPFIVIRKSDNKIVGSTRYLNIESAMHRLEIGSTWYAASAQKTGINTECKYLLLKHAFEDLDCLAVEFRTHRFNEESRRAISRLGAVQDGILRNHRLMPDGTVRDTVVYSILNTEWPTVQSHLLFKM